jgi:drug/metabolite transporter (DMT)-like permease
MGEIAGLLCAFFWAISATLFSESSIRIGSGVVNRIRLLIGFILFLITNTIVLGEPLPISAGWERWLLFGASGILGLAIGDGLMYRAYTMIGTRLAMLVTAFSPIISALVAWLFLGEELTLVTIIGIMVAASGVGIVVLERREVGRTRSDQRKYLLGLLASFIAVVMYAFGMVMSKKGLENNFPTVAGVVIRMVFAGLATWMPALLVGKVAGEIRNAFKDRIAMKYLAIGSLIGPFGGVWLSFVALQNAKVGVASMLMSTAPIFLLPIAKWVQKEQLSWRAVLGTLLAIAGVAVIFLVK